MDEIIIKRQSYWHVLKSDKCMTNAAISVKLQHNGKQLKQHKSHIFINFPIYYTKLQHRKRYTIQQTLSILCYIWIFIKKKLVILIKIYNNCMQ